MKLLTVKEACQRLRISRATLYNLIKRGGPCLRQDRRKILDQGGGDRPSHHSRNPDTAEAKSQD